MKIINRINSTLFWTLMILLFFVFIKIIDENGNNNYRSTNS